MTWEQLVEKVKDIQAIKIYGNCIEYRPCSYLGLDFFSNGNIDFWHNSSGLFDTTISENRTPDQMYAIITAITETKE